MRRVAAVTWLAIAILAVTRNGAAQDAPPPTSRVELWGALAGVIDGPAGSLTTSYSPPLLFDGAFTSSGGQTLIVETGPAMGLSTGVDVFPTRLVGFGAAVHRAAHSISGANGPYALALRYESRPPPDNVPQIVDLRRSTPWPDTSGSITVTTVAFTAVVRLAASRRIGARIRGGPAIVRISGDAAPIGFTAFRLGGHSVLFEDEHRVAVALGPDNALGISAGAEIDVALGSRAAVTIGYGYVGGSDATVEVRPSTLVNQSEVIVQQPLDEIASRLSARPMRVPLSSSRVFAGIRLGL